MAEFHIVSYEISNYNLYAIFFSILKIVDLVLLSIFIPVCCFIHVKRQFHLGKQPLLPRWNSCFIQVEY